MGRKIHDLTGKKFGRLTVIRSDPTRYFYHVLWHCLCDCGKEVLVDSGRLKKGATTSCGCRLTEYRQSLQESRLKRCEQIQALLASGHNASTAAKTLGITPQRVHQILNGRKKVV